MQMMQQSGTEEFKEKLLELFDVSKREYLHGQALAIGETLTGMLLRKNGLEELFMALDELDSKVWESAAILTALAKLLTKKPAKVKSREKYHAFILREFMLLVKKDRWSPKLQLFLPKFLVAMFEAIFKNMHTPGSSTKLPGSSTKHSDPQLSHYLLLTSLIEQLLKLDLSNAEMPTEILRVCNMFLKHHLAKLRMEPELGFDVRSSASKELAQLELNSLKLVVSLVCAVIIQLQADDQSALFHLESAVEQMSELKELLKKRAGRGDDDVDELLAGVEQFLKLLHMSIDDGTQASAGKVPFQGKSSLTTKPSESNEKPLEKLLVEFQRLEMAEDGDEELTNAMLGHHLIELARVLRQRDSQGAITDPAHFEQLFAQLTELLESHESYVYLAAINALAELVALRTDDFLGRAVELFTCWHPSGKVPSTSDETKAVLVRAKLGEALAKIARNLGDFSPHYFDSMASSLLAMAGEQQQNDQVRASALSTLAELVQACRGRHFERHMHQLLQCIDQLLLLDSNVLVRRAAVHLLRAMVASAVAGGGGQLMELSNSLTPLTGKLCRLVITDPDEVVRLHADLALTEIREELQEWMLKTA